MSEPAKRGATYQDVLDAPEHMVAELIDGELHLQPRPARPHATSASVLGAQLLVEFQLRRAGSSGWWIIDEPELHFGAEVLVPDIAGWRRDVVESLDKDLAYYDEIPTWVCEVLSPRTERIDRIKKLHVYHQAHVKFAWLVHPVNHTIEVYERADNGWVLTKTHDGEGPFTARPFEDFEIDTATLWL